MLSAFAGVAVGCLVSPRCTAVFGGLDVDVDGDCVGGLGVDVDGLGVDGGLGVVGDGLVVGGLDVDDVGFGVDGDFGADGGGLEVDGGAPDGGDCFDVGFGVDGGELGRACVGAVRAGAGLDAMGDECYDANCSRTINYRNWLLLCMWAAANQNHL